MGNCYVQFWIGSEGGDSLTDYTLGGRPRGSSEPNGGRVDPWVARTDSQPQGPRSRTARGS